MTDSSIRRRPLMRKSLLLTGLVGALVAPAAARAGDTPTSGDRQNAAQECRFERGSTAATREAFAAKYGTGKHKRNAYGKCVSKKSREEASEREDASTGAAQTCRSERGTTAATQDAFAEKYGTGKNKRNAFGKCVSQHAKAAEQQADDEDSEQATD